MKQQTVISIGKKTFILEAQDFGNLPIDLEQILQVDYNNVIGDMITWPVLYNRLGLIKAEIDDFVRQQELDMSIFEAQKRQEERGKYTIEFDAKGKEKRKYPTVGEVEDGVLRCPEYKVKKQQLNRVKKEADIVNSLYNAAKSKDRKLDAISMKLRPEEFETDLIEETINSVLIRSRQNFFEKKR